MTDPDADVVLAGAAAQAALVRDGDLSARELIEATLRQIERLDPDLNAYRVVLADEAIAAADAVDSGAVAGPLAGVPVAIKDDTDVAGQVTAWGTAAHGPAPTVDSDVVARLRAAGAIVIGKTNVPEMTLWPWTASTTWGITRNPWDLDRTPGGSSGGSAVAVATGMCGMALGSDGGGSVRNPAAHTGLFGLKTQRGRIPLGPSHDDAWNGLTVYGPIARTVADAALFLDGTSDDRPPGGFVAGLARPPKRLRVAVSFRSPPGTTGRLGGDRRSAVEATADLLASLGHHVFRQEIDYGRRATGNATVRYLSGLADDVRTLAAPSELERNTRRLAAIGRRIPAGVRRRARVREGAIAGRINRVFDDADVVLTPMTAAGPPSLVDVLDRGLVRSSVNAGVSAWAVPWNTIGQPAASIPARLDADGLPIAVQLGGRPHDEATILAVAAELERARPWVDERAPILHPLRSG